MEAVKASLENIGEVVSDIKYDNKTNTEILESIYQIVEDISKKLDEFLNAGLKKPITKPKSSSKADTYDEGDDIEEDDETPAPKAKARNTARKKQNNIEPDTTTPASTPVLSSSAASEVPALISETPKGKSKTAKSVKAEASIDEEKQKPIVNITSFFKNKYEKDPTIFDDILEENQAKSVIAANADKLNTKKGVQKIRAQADLIFKSLTADQKKKIYDMKDADLNESD